MTRNAFALAVAGAAVAALAATALPAAAQAVNHDRTPTLIAHGEGSVSVVPDLATVTMGVTTRARSADGALNANSGDLSAVIETVRGAGVEDRDIGTSGFSISPIYEHREDIGERPPAIVGYQVSNQIRVVIRDIDTSGALLDRVVRAGANTVNGISFDIDDRTAAEDRALAAAIADANRKAGLMAEAAGVRLVRVLEVTGGENRGGPMFERMAMAAPSGPAPVMPGERQITANATVTWEIAP